MNGKLLAIAVAVMAIVFAATGYAALRERADQVTDVSVPTARIVDGVQYVDITAKGGYAPRVVSARAGMPTVLRVATSGTYDCSASLVIPQLRYQKLLPASGSEEIALTPEQARGELKGLCSMGMYRFEVVFR